MGVLFTSPKVKCLGEKAAKASAIKPIRLPSRFDDDEQVYRLVLEAKEQASMVDKTRMLAFLCLLFWMGQGVVGEET